MNGPFQARPLWKRLLSITPAVAVPLSVVALVPWLIAGRPQSGSWAVGTAVLVLYPIIQVTLLSISAYLKDKVELSRDLVRAIYWGVFAVSAAVFVVAMLA